MTEAQRGKIICSKLHSKEVAEAEVEPRQFGFRVHALNYLPCHLPVHTSWRQTQNSVWAWVKSKLLATCLYNHFHCQDWKPAW